MANDLQHRFFWRCNLHGRCVGSETETVCETRTREVCVKVWAARSKAESRLEIEPEQLERGLDLVARHLHDDAMDNASKYLLLFGGGIVDTEALRQFVDWAGGSKHAKILVITWASEEAELIKKIFVKRLHALDVQNVDFSLTPPVTRAEKCKVLTQLNDATGVFFSGGDQNRILDVLSDPDLKRAFHHRYESGVAFAGTSAGTAIMSALSITGDADSTILSAKAATVREGLGLLPDMIVDQHFLKRQRQNRLFGLALEHPEKLCIGVDEDAALAILDNRFAQVMGASQVVFVEAHEQVAGSMAVNVLNPKEGFDLTSRTRIHQTDLSILLAARQRLLDLQTAPPFLSQVQL